MVLGAVVSALILAPACSKGSSVATTSGTTAPPAVATSPGATTPPTSASPTPPAASDLSGTWSGQYSGAYSGKFTLTWTQSGSKVSGNIDLVAFGGSVPIDGTLKGDRISFGTVGSTDITYSGSVSGDSMSGTYKVHTPNGSSGGPWSATRSS
jgi:hypothetical protein